MKKAPGDGKYFITKAQTRTSSKGIFSSRNKNLNQNCVCILKQLFHGLRWRENSVLFFERRQILAVQ
jgi:hypothetical protein